MNNLILTVSEHPFAAMGVLMGACALIREISNLLEGALRAAKPFRPNVTFEIDGKKVAHQTADYIADSLRETKKQRTK